MAPIIQEPNKPVHLPPAALDWALEHARAFGDTVFLPAAFEYEAIKHDWSHVKGWLQSQDMVSWKPRPLRRFLAAKSRFSFRYVSQLDPLEYLAFTALIHEIGPELEGGRIPASDTTIFSWRFAPLPSGQMYDPESEWTQFNARCLEFASEVDCEWVVVADVADFFPHLYIHPVERALATAKAHLPESYCVMRMIRNWNAFVSYGLPVGVSGSRIIAEATINDVDLTVRGLGNPYCRYADDMRIFCETEEDAYQALEELASVLFENHGLTLQPIKTEIMSTEAYRKRFAIAPARLEAESLTSRFHELLDDAGISDRYDAELDYESLPDRTQKEIDKLNLSKLFEEQIQQERADPVVMRILLHRMGQLDMADAVDDLIDNLEDLGHIIDGVVRYLRHLRSLSETRREQVGSLVLNACDYPSTSSYQRACLLSLFTENREFDNEDRFEGMFRSARDAPTRRKLMLALGRAGKTHVLQRLRRDHQAMDPWLRRAFLAAYSSVPKDARTPFYRSLRGGADVLEAAVIKWAEANPFA